MKSGARPANRPKPLEKESLGGILIRHDGSVAVLSEKFFLIDYYPQRAAVGSGGDFALALMNLGMSAPQAVQKVIDSRLDINTGGTVHTLTLRKKAIRKS